MSARPPGGLGVDHGLQGPEHPGDLLSAHLDDELPADLAAEVEAHLTTCADCRSDIDELAGARDSLRSLPRLAAPPGLGQAIVRSRQRASRRGLALAVVAASVAVIAGLLVAPVTPDDSTDHDQALSLASKNARFDADMTTGPTGSLGNRPGNRPTPTSSASGSPSASAGADESAGGKSGDRSFAEQVGDAVVGLLDTIG